MADGEWGVCGNSEEGCDEDAERALCVRPDLLREGCALGDPCPAEHLQGLPIQEEETRQVILLQLRFGN